jgi:Rrf2 family protein
MKRHSRLSAALHALGHMAQQPEASRTSDEVARWLDTNPVVVRRVFAGLREAGILTTERGRGGGMILARGPAEISLAEISDAMGESLLPIQAEPESTSCLIERAVNELLADFRREAEALLRARLAEISLADVTADFRNHLETGALKHHGS